MTIRPQPGPQEKFLATPADIAIYGGAAGGGKTFGILLEALRHSATAGFFATIFRRNVVQIRNPGGLWDESLQLYPQAGGVPLQMPLEWKFPGGGKIKFSHLEYDRSVLDWQGSQITLLGFDELTHFSQSQFWYMLSRNRSVCGVRPYVRATCNPDADSWVAEFIAWWLDERTGYPIPERSGRIRWMVRDNNTVHWADGPDELISKFGLDAAPKSVTFIASSIYDNQKLMDVDPGYLANLKALPLVERERLLGGNWKIRPAAGLLFQRSWVDIVDAPPERMQQIRYWDLAATEKTETNDPDYTTSIKMGRAMDGRIYVLHGMSMRVSPHKVLQAIKNMAAQDGKQVVVGIPQDPGQAGKSQAVSFVKELVGWNVVARRETGDKVTRFGPFSAQCEAGNVSFVRGAWNDEFFDWLEGFPDAAHDDHVDACSGAFNYLVEIRRGLRIGK